MDTYEDFFYVAFRLETTAHGKVIDSERQIRGFEDRFKRRFHTQPAQVLIGPFFMEKAGNKILLVPDGYVYMQIPASRQKASPGHFLTGYEGEA